MLCHIRSSDYDYNYTVFIYSQNESISQFRYETILNISLAMWNGLFYECHY